jgi:signal transduction histidine kinase/CheY-like chemotaxis protein
MSVFTGVSDRIWRLGRTHTDALRDVLLTIVVSGTCIGLLWFGVNHSLQIERDAAEQAGIENTSNLARVFADNTARAIRQIDDALLLARDNYLQNPSGFDPGELGRSRRFISGFTFQLSLVGPDGILKISSLGSPQTPVNLSDREHFSVHVRPQDDRLFISKPVLGRVSGKWSVQMSRRITLPDGSFGGVLVISVDPDYLADFYSTIDLGEDGSIALIGLDHIVRARTAGDTGIRLGQVLPNSDWLQSDVVAGHVLWTGSLDGVKRLLAYRIVSDLPLAVTVAQSTTQVLARYSRSSRDYRLAAGVLSAMILLAGGTVMSHQLISYRARFALRRSAAEQQATLENMGQGIMMIDADGIVAVLNRRAIDLLGLPAHLVTGRPRFQAILAWQLSQREFGADDGPIREIVRQNENDEERIKAPSIYERQRPDGRWLEVRSVAMPDGRMVRTFSDITARKATELALAAARDAAEAASRARSDFLAVMSHEMRTPLNGVIGMATLLTDSGLRDDQSGFAATLDASARHLLQLIDDVLDFSRLEAGKVELEDQEFSLAAVVNTVAQMLAPRAAEKGLKIAVYLDSRLPESAHGDARRLRQVLLNLLGNAIKFTEIGGVTIRAHVPETSCSDFTRVCFVVNDTGIGIDPSAKESLFNEFIQADSSISRRFGGTGLGLAISRRIVEAMGGTIKFDSQPEQGTAFYFDITVKGRRTQSPALLQSCKILLIDDLALTRATLADQLSDLGATVVHAAALSEVLPAEVHQPPQEFNLVILDCKEAHAYATAIQMRWPHTTIVAIGEPLSGKATEAPQGFDRYLARPLTATAIAGLVDASSNPRKQAEHTPPVQSRSTGQNLGLRILVAEDNVVNQRVAAAMLSKNGCTPCVVSNGREAVEALTTGSYDVVLMDMMMPEMDGLSAVRTIRALPDTGREIPVVMLTAATSTADILACRDAGADEFLAKPIDFEQLSHVLRRYQRKAHSISVLRSDVPPQPATA